MNAIQLALISFLLISARFEIADAKLTPMSNYWKPISHNRFGDYYQCRKPCIEDEECGKEVGICGFCCEIRLVCVRSYEKLYRPWPLSNKLA
uniref:Uncharacterized protein n=1 Tax=Plectus sambesii TaxID=2011161 RepID=A0A914XM70_9BILA